MAEHIPDAAPEHGFTFALLPNFSLLSFAAALDVLRIANRMSGQACYRWQIVAEDGIDVACSAGTLFRVDSDLPETTRSETIILCGGLDVQAATSRKLLAWLRRAARQGAAIGGVCTAAYPMARAGLLDGRRATIHWENHDSFAEEFINVDLSKAVYTIDGAFYTTAGGTASIDLMLRLVARDFGEDLAASVADQIIYSSIRTDQDTQRLSVPSRIGVRHPKLAEVVQRMEASIEDPISPAILSRDVGLSTRQLERLFRRYLNRSPKRYYMELRLSKARNLLLQTDMSVINVALACGFTSPSHFSKCYRAQYHTTPYRERGT